MFNHTAGAERASFYREISERNMAPLWESLHRLVTKEPVSPVVPAHWPYAVIRPDIMRAGSIISATEAERRVLILENPGLHGQAAITRTLYAGLQLILPGEVAPSHRHSQSALRFVIEGSGAFTAVDGERTIMNPGDFIITPSWTWHDHGNPSDQPTVWLDGLDIPLITALDASYAEAGAAAQQQVRRPEGDALARYGQGLLPVDWRPERPSSPVFNYPYGRTREALYTMSRGGPPDPCHGYKLRYVNPASGDSAIPTISTCIQLLHHGIATAPYRSSDATVFVVVEGIGSSEIGGMRFNWESHDVIVAPPWTWLTHAAASDAVIFSFSDRAVQEKLGLWREDRGPV